MRICRTGKKFVIYCKYAPCCGQCFLVGIRDMIKLWVQQK